MNTDSILVYKFRPERTGFNMYADYTRPQLTFLALHPWFGPLQCEELSTKEPTLSFGTLLIVFKGRRTRITRKDLITPRFSAPELPLQIFK